MSLAPPKYSSLMRNGWFQVLVQVPSTGTKNKILCSVSCPGDKKIRVFGLNNILRL